MTDQQPAAAPSPSGEHTGDTPGCEPVETGAAPVSRDTLDELMSALRQQRDELKVRMHLGELDAREEFDRLSAKLEELAEDYEPLTDAVSTTAENVLTALSLAGEELLTGFQRVRKAIAKKESDQ